MFNHPRSNPGACREPMARIRQHSIPLCNPARNIQEWVIAYSDRELFYQTTTKPLVSLNISRHSLPQSSLRNPADVQTLIAVAVSGYFGGSRLMRGIRIWKADDATFVGTIERWVGCCQAHHFCSLRVVFFIVCDRFYPGCFEVRAAGSTHRNLERRYSPIWSMKVHPPTTCILAGCANGTIEVRPR